MPLYITNVNASCGCTATDYTKEPVAPGAKVLLGLHTTLEIDLVS